MRRTKLKRLLSMLMIIAILLPGAAFAVSAAEPEQIYDLFETIEIDRILAVAEELKNMDITELIEMLLMLGVTDEINIAYMREILPVLQKMSAEEIIELFELVDTETKYEIWLLLASLELIVMSQPADPELINEIFAMMEMYSYSDWAYWYIFMASTAYGLGNADTYTYFKSDVTWEKFKPVFDSIGQTFYDQDWSSVFDVHGEARRGAIIMHLYTLILRFLQIESVAGTEYEALEYFIENGLINGRASGGYQLDEICTVEEMIIFSVRVYEHLMYELGLDSKGFFWKVTGENNIVYLLGSIHASDGSLYPMSKEILDAFDSAKYIGFEIFDVTEEDMDYYISKIFITDGTTIADHIDPEMYEFYAEVWEFFGIPQEIYDYIQPWAAWSDLQYLLIAMNEETETVDDIFDNMELMAALGVDNYFMDMAYFTGKELMQLESLISQADMLSSFSPDLQEALLGGILFEFYRLFYGDEELEEYGELGDTMDGFFTAMLAAWKSGDEVFMLELTGRDIEWEHPLDIEYNYKMLTERDIAMTDKIIVILNESEDIYFIIVGAAHLIGTGSIIDLLIKAGFEVERIK